MTRRIGPLPFLLGALMLPVALQAQRGSAVMFGVVVNKLTQGPIPNAEIVHSGDGRTVKADSLGYFQFPNLAAGIVRFAVRAPGYRVSTIALAFTNGERMERDIELDTLMGPVAAPTAREAQPLPTVSVEASPSMGVRFRDFERRKATGRGHYLTRSQIEQKGANNLVDAVKDLRGVTVDCGGGAGCYIRMARAPNRCLPLYIVDERPDEYFGPTVAVRDIEALEVYTGPSDVPGEFAGSAAGCGVIVIWTKSGPPRKR